MSTNTSHSPSHSRFLKPTILLSSKQDPTNPIFHDIKIPDHAKYFKKYFGHKVTYVERSTQLIPVLHSRKFLQRIAFDNGTYQKNHFKCSFDMIILGDDIETPERVSKKILKGFYGKLSLTFNRETNNISQYLKNNLNNLQGLEITLKEIEQFGLHRGAFDGLRSLQSFSLKFNAEDCGWDDEIKTLDFDPHSCEENPLCFLFLLLQKTHLKRLKLNLAPYPLSSFALSYLLLFIEQEKIPDWYVKSGMMVQGLGEFTNGKDVQSSPNFPLNLTNSSEVIQKIDFFGLYVTNFILEKRDDNWYSDESGSKEFSPFILSELPQLTFKSHKVLDITIAEEVERPDIILTTLLEKFSSLEGLYIKAREKALKFEKSARRKNSESEDEEKGSKIEAKDFPWMKNLKQALLSIVDAKFDWDGEDSSHKPFEDLMRHLKDYCPTLESLNVFSASTTYVDKHDSGVTSRGENHVKVPCESLTGFNSLQELEINSDERGLNGVTQTLESLKNLRKLKLNFCDNVGPFTFGEKQDIWDDQREDIFEGLKQLKEFELAIRPDQSEMTAPPLYWAKYFAKNLHKLKKLEVLRVFDSKEIEIQIEVCLRILKELSQLTSLREIVIHSKIVSNEESLEMAADLYEDASGTEGDRLIGLMKSRLNRIIHLNPNLRLVDIRSFENMKVDFIFYKAK